jgi:hypothetical protein
MPLGRHRRASSRWLALASRAGRDRRIVGDDAPAEEGQHSGHDDYYQDNVEDRYCGHWEVSRLLGCARPSSHPFLRELSR